MNTWWKSRPPSCHTATPSCPGWSDAVATESAKYSRSESRSSKCRSRWRKKAVSVASIWGLSGSHIPTSLTCGFNAFHFSGGRIVEPPAGTCAGGRGHADFEAGGCPRMGFINTGETSGWTDLANTVTPRPGDCGGGAGGSKIEVTTGPCAGISTPAWPSGPGDGVWLGDRGIKGLDWCVTTCRGERLPPLVALLAESGAKGASPCRGL
mmetsp:Transcript_86319/g.225142  ORF Transcript_86319/g.225142 Transcript_86319/m.225142 type:complete len:209 (-) Transcript_86319:444-1070(-)